MLSYIPQTNFRRKDNLESGNPDKIISGSELAAEFSAIKRSINSTGTATYTITTDYKSEDAQGATILGADLDVEFDAIAAALLAAGVTYTPTFDGAAADAADSEILATTLMVEFEAISTAIVSLRLSLNNGITLEPHTAHSRGDDGSGSQEPVFTMTFDTDGRLKLNTNSDVSAKLTLDGVIVSTLGVEYVVVGEWADTAVWTQVGLTAADFDVKVTFAKTGGTMTSAATVGSQSFGSFVNLTVDKYWERQASVNNSTYEESTWTVAIRLHSSQAVVATKVWTVRLLAD